MTLAVLFHIHELNPEMSRLVAGHKILSRGLMRILEANHRVGVPVAKNIRSPKARVGGPDKLGCLPEDCVITLTVLGG